MKALLIESIYLVEVTVVVLSVLVLRIPASTSIVTYMVRPLVREKLKT